VSPSTCAQCGEAARPGAGFCVACGIPLAPKPAVGALPAVSALPPVSTPPRSRSNRGRSALAWLRMLSLLAGVGTSGLGAYRLLEAKPASSRLLAAVAKPAVLSRPAVAREATSKPAAKPAPTRPAPTPTTSTSAVTTTPTATSPAGTPASVTCSNHAEGFLVRLPSGWQDYSTTAAQKCESLDTKAPTSGATTPITITPISLRYSDAVSTYTNSSQVTVLSKTATTVSGVPAVRVELARVGDPNPSAKTYVYIIDHGNALLLAAESPQSPDFAAAKAAVDSIASSLEFFT
jgi:hypothetical protein